jgi:hypothetical protein
VPRPRTNEYWRRLALQEYENSESLSPAQIEYKLAAVYRLEKDQRPDLPQPPKRKTIDRMIKAHKLSPPEVRIQYRYASWPEAMQDGLLPWEASRALLDLLGRYHAFGPPTIPFARWFWRVTQAAPGATLEERRDFAALLMASDVFGAERFSDELDALKWNLAYAPWHSVENAAKYRDVINRGAVREFEPGIDHLLTQDEAYQHRLAIEYGKAVLRPRGSRWGAWPLEEEKHGE